MLFLPEGLQTTALIGDGMLRLLELLFNSRLMRLIIAQPAVVSTDRAKSPGKTPLSLDFPLSRLDHRAQDTTSKTRQIRVFGFRSWNVHDCRLPFRRGANVLMRRALLSLALAGCLAASFTTDAGAQRQPGVRSQPREEPPFSCGTDGDRIQQLLGRRPKAFSPGTPVFFRQEPAVIVGDWTTITLREFTVLGDVETLRFQLYYENADVETWTRTETRDVAGRVVSVFNPTWPVATLGKVLRFNRWGWDNPRLYWGEVLREGVEPGSGLPIYLRIAPETLPAARVVRVRDDLQYSGNVVNIVMPTFADGFPDDEFGFDLGGAAQRFYRDFQDTYDDLAFVTQETFLSSYQGFHRNVRNEVRGIGLDPFDFTATYGSTNRRLQAAEMYPSAGVTLHSTSSHEIAHQWATTSTGPA
jgi:hypothetical protein